MLVTLPACTRIWKSGIGSPFTQSKEIASRKTVSDLRLLRYGSGYLKKRLGQSFS
ncbi:hypothetical protein BN903_334 [Halorubrum sp. AJ67]|nr:hypothetical protein BN903_334 [Halorubrum sp. AJ67]